MNKTTPNGITFSNDNNVGATVRIGRLEVMTKELGWMDNEIRMDDMGRR